MTKNKVVHIDKDYLVILCTTGEDKAARDSKKNIYFGISIKCVAMQSMLYQLTTYFLNSLKIVKCSILFHVHEITYNQL